LKPRTLLVLAVLVAALGSFIWFWERRQPSSSERAERGKKLVRVEADDVAAVAITVEGRTVRLEREPALAAPSGGDTTVTPASAAPVEGWRIVAPIQAIADRWAIERLIESVDGLEKQRTLDDPDRQALGLAEPRAVLAFEKRAGKGEPVVIEFGAKLPAAAAMAVAVRGEPSAAVVADAIYADLGKPAGDWRSREMFTAPRDAIERLLLSSAGAAPVRLARRGESFWLEAPLTDRADRDLVNGLLSDLVSLRAAAFLDAPPAPATEMGLEPAASTIEAVLEGQESPYRLELGRPTADPNRRYARVGGQLFTTESKIADAISRSAPDWQSPTWSASEVFRIDAVRLEGPMTQAAEPTVLARAEGDWKRGAVTVTFTTVSDLLYAITGAKSAFLLGKAEAESRGANLAAPVLTVTLTASGGSEEILTLYPPLASGPSPAMSSGREVVLLLNAPIVQEIGEKLAAVQKAEPEPPAEAAAKATTAAGS
jgi:hypothetical protein